MAKTKKIVAIGGGTGTFTLLSGLRDYPDLDITAIMTMVDDGGSNKVLRDEFGLLPTSGIRQAIVALAKDQSLLRQLFSYRYYQGVGISGMTFGNLFMAALADILGSQEAAITETCKLLGVKGRILPVSYSPASLLATYDNGVEVLGEHYIDISSAQVAKHRIANLRTIPAVKLDPAAQKAILAADLIVIGPGDLYTNTIANLVVSGVVDSIKKSYARVCFVMNLMTKAGESYNYQASDFLTDLAHYLPPDRLDYVLLNNNLRLPPSVLTRYKREGSKLVVDDLSDTYYRAKVLRLPLYSPAVSELKQKGDKLIRSMIRHEPSALAKAIYEL